jgi:hypothetical protein
MKKILIAKVAIVIILFICYKAEAQRNQQGVTIGIKGSTSIKDALLFEKNYPEKIKKPYVSANEHDEEHEKKQMQNEVPSDVPTFSGKQTFVKETAINKSPEQTTEFPCNNFNALNEISVASPPDVNGAAGFNHLMVTLNSDVRIQSKQGDVISTVSLTAFWNGLGGHTDIFDPKITYDPYDRRWIFVCAASRESNASALLLAVSQTSDPTGGWIVYTIDADVANQVWFDYPSLGFNRNWITVGGNMINMPNVTGQQRGRVFVINKAVVYAANSTIPVSIFDRTNYRVISPAITYDRLNNTQWLVGLHNNNSNNSGFYRLFSITGTQSAPVLNDGAIINVGSAWAAGGVNGPQKNTSVGFDLGDDRILQSTFRLGRLWVGNNVFLPATNPTTCAAQIISINTSNNTVDENIRTAANTNGSIMQAYPSITVNSRNDIFFGYSTFRNDAYVASTVLYRRNDGQGFFFYYYKPSDTVYIELSPDGRNRWGDYSATCIDPEDDISAWTIQPFAWRRVLGKSIWSTWWAKICPGFCDNVYSFSGVQNNVMRKYEANNTISSSDTIQNGSFIKYDAGVKITLSPGFKVLQGNNFQGYIEGCGGVR